MSDERAVSFAVSPLLKKAKDSQHCSQNRRTGTQVCELEVRITRFMRKIKGMDHDDSFIGNAEEFGGEKAVRHGERMIHCHWTRPAQRF